MWGRKNETNQDLQGDLPKVQKPAPKAPREKKKDPPGGGRARKLKEGRGTQAANRYDEMEKKRAIDAQKKARDAARAKHLGPKSGGGGGGKGGGSMLGGGGGSKSRSSRSRSVGGGGNGFTQNRSSRGKGGGGRSSKGWL
jgi:hypothetical protein